MLNKKVTNTNYYNNHSYKWKKEWRGFKRQGNYFHTVFTWKRISSAYYQQSNSRAELAIKTAKRILANNTDGYGRLYHDRAANALLTQRNTLVQNLSMSTAIMLYGCIIKDLFSVSNT